ncbi:hypothetical protein [Pseudonocardia endophytica]|uniref:hypothetical protein n=1 Tax=Pseudonocardia endophytica TaxID=401976 RepID=UPI001045A9D3|nr:hypothetical protein [Pseudonocardia endophytica]
MDTSHKNGVAPAVLYAAALRLLGPAPDRLAVPCERCAAPPDAECAWTRSPGPPVLHAERRRRVDGLAAAHAAAVDALAAWAAALGSGGPVHAAGIRARHRYRLLRMRAGSVGWPVPALPGPAVVLSAARAVPA